jgi:hypothetical protein
MPTAIPTMMAGKDRNSDRKNRPRLKWPLGSMRLTGLLLT